MRFATCVCAASIALVMMSAATIEARALPEGFVHLSEVDPTIVQDMRYAGADNFLGRRVAGYEAPSCILTGKAARALAAVQSNANARGYTIVVFDCYRPASAVADFVGWTGTGGASDPRWYPATRRGDLVAKGYIGRDPPIRAARRSTSRWRLWRRRITAPPIRPAALPTRGARRPRISAPASTASTRRAAPTAARSAPMRRRTAAFWFR